MSLLAVIMLRQKNDIFASFHLLAFYSIVKIFIFKVVSLFKVKPKVQKRCSMITMLLKVLFLTHPNLVCFPELLIWGWRTCEAFWDHRVDPNEQKCIVSSKTWYLTLFCKTWEINWWYCLAFLLYHKKKEAFSIIRKYEWKDKHDRFMCLSLSFFAHSRVSE